MPPTTTTSPSTPVGGPLDGFGDPAPTLRRPRNLPGAILGVLVIVVCSLAVVALTSSADHRTEVLVVVRPVAAGTVIQAADLSVTGITAGHVVRGIDASRADAVVGRVAAGNLVVGALLVPADLSDGPVVGRGMSVVGLSLRPGALPSGVAPNDTVMALSTPTGSDTTATGRGGVLVAGAEVYAVGPSPDGQSTLVSLAVPSAAAPAVAAANAEGGVSLALVGG